MLNINLFQDRVEFTAAILDWYDEHQRDLPWRKTRDPYKIWVSEVVLQQTRVEQGLSYYTRFLDRFPDVSSLAEADEEEVLRVWQGLGYYSRARNMHHSARKITSEGGQKFPANYTELRKLKGIGDYSASAIASIAYGEPRPAIDGNVVRLISRYLGMRGQVKNAAGRKKISEFLQKHIDTGRPGDFNQALIDLGAMVCRKYDPSCHGCPIQKGCYAFKKGLTGTIPPPSGARPPVILFVHYFVIHKTNGQDRFIWLKKRTGQGIWKNLYDFPSIEAGRELSFEELVRNKEWKYIAGESDFIPVHPIVTQRHLLSHRDLRIKYFILDGGSYFHPAFEKINFSLLHKYPVPRPIEKFLEKFFTDRVFFHNFPINQ